MFDNYKALPFILELEVKVQKRKSLQVGDFSLENRESAASTKEFSNIFKASFENTHWWKVE